MTCQVRFADFADAQLIAEAHLASVLVGFRGLFPRVAPVPTLAGLTSEWEHFLTTPAYDVFVAIAGDQLAGSAVARPDPDDPSVGQLSRLYVAPACWGQGIGGQLHDHVLHRLAERQFKQARLWVLEGNGRARAMYERRDWRLDGGTRPGPAAVPEIRYSRELPTVAGGA